MTENPNQEWQLRLFGEFSLTDPSGAVIRLPDRKVEGLLAILALNSEYGMERREIADMLWAERADNLSNLRQALSVLRRVLDSDAIEASRSHCRLSGRVRLANDYESPTLRGKGGFMPGHEGDWFEDIRRETIEDEPTLSVIAHFLQTLQWFSIHDPRGMYALMSATPPMVRSISYEAMERLLRATTESNAVAGWHAYWRGTAEVDLEECAALLRTALREARRSGDKNLASETCYELGKVYSRMGNIEKALRICDIADEVAAGSPSPSAKSNALRLRGTVEVNWRLGQSGFTLLELAEEFIDAPVERATALSTRAFFEASAGLHERASFTIERAEMASPRSAALPNEYCKSDYAGHPDGRLGSPHRGDHSDGSPRREISAGERHSVPGVRTGVCRQALRDGR